MIRNRRKYPRLKIPLEAEYRVEGTDEWHQGTIRTLGAGGAALLCEQELPLGTELSQVHFVLEADGELPETRLEVGARVVNAARLEDVGREVAFLLGLQFASPEEREFELLRRFVFQRLTAEEAGSSDGGHDGRAAAPAPIAIRFKRFDDFVEEVSENLSPSGMFIRGSRPLPPGSKFPFQFQLGEEFALFQGTAEVVWTRRRSEGPDKPAGMGVRFLKLDLTSQKVVTRLMEQRGEEEGAVAESREPSAPARTAAEPPLFEAADGSEEAPLEPATGFADEVDAALDGLAGRPAGDGEAAASASESGSDRERGDALAAAEAREEELRRQVARLGARVGEAEDARERLLGRVEELSGETESLRRQVGKLESARQAADAARQSAEAEAAAARAELEARREPSGLEADLERLHERWEAREAELEAELERLGAGEAELRRQYDKAVAGEAELVLRLEEFQGAHRELDQRLELSLATEAELKGRVGALERLLEAAETERDELAAQLEAQRAENDALRRVGAEAREGLRQVSDEVREALQRAAAEVGELVALPAPSPADAGDAGGAGRSLPSDPPQLALGLDDRQAGTEPLSEPEAAAASELDAPALSSFPLDDEPTPAEPGEARATSAEIRQALGRARELIRAQREAAKSGLAGSADAIDPVEGIDRAPLEGVDPEEAAEDASAQPGACGLELGASGEDGTAAEPEPAETLAGSFPPEPAGDPAAAPAEHLPGHEASQTGAGESGQAASPEPVAAASGQPADEPAGETASPPPSTGLVGMARRALAWLPWRRRAAAGGPAAGNGNGNGAGGLVEAKTVPVEAAGEPVGGELEPEVSPAASGDEEAPAEADPSPRTAVLAPPPDPAEIEARVAAWAAAWSEQRVDDYLGFYSRHFRPPAADGEWGESARAAQMLPVDGTRLSLGELSQEVVAADRVSVTFEQSVETEHFSHTAQRTLELVREDGGWMIVAESFGE